MRKSSVDSKGRTQRFSINPRISHTGLKFVRHQSAWHVIGAPSGDVGTLESLGRRNKYHISAICAALGCSHRHFLQTFVRDIGLQPRNWISQQRMVIARHLLAAGMGANQVAPEIGSFSAEAFRRHFRKIYGMSPDRYVATRQRLAGLDPESNQTGGNGSRDPVSASE